MKRSYIYITISFFIGFLFAAILSVYASRFYVESVRLTLLSNSENIGKNDMANDNVDGALFHFRNMIFLMQNNTYDSMVKLSDNWTLTYPIYGAITNYFYDENVYKYSYKISMGTAKALYGFALESSGNEMKALAEYEESSNLLGFKDPQKAKKLAEISVNSVAKLKLKGTDLF